VDNKGSKTKSLVPYALTSPGFEAIYTGQKSSSSVEKTDILTTLTTDRAGNVIRKWSVFSWTFPGQEKDWDDEIRYLNEMQLQLGPLSDGIRQVRAHIASLVPCDSGFPVTVDELLAAIGRQRLEEPSFRNGCWCGGMWWQQKTTQPSHLASMKTIHAVLTGYLAGRCRDDSLKDFPHAAGFIQRTYDWLGPLSEFTEVQRLMLQRVLLIVDYFTGTSDTVPSPFPDEAQMREGAALVEDIFGEAGRGARLDQEISEKAGLPQIHPHWNPKFQENLQSLDDPQRRELYKVCGGIASGVATLSDCHHGTFRYIESWIHGIGTGKSIIPTRQAGAERERLGRLLFGYVLGLDKWLLGVPMQFLLLDLAHLDLGFDPRNEILRVYAYLGEEKTAVKLWLAACLWHNLTYSPIDAGNPAGLVRHKDLLDQAARLGVSLREWMDSLARGAGQPMPDQ
jgi:hypothetical protein